MNDDLESVEEPSAAEMTTIDALLARSDAWDAPSAELEDRVVAAITSEAAALRGRATPTSLDDRRERRAGRSTRWWLSAAAACVVIIGGAVVLSGAFGDDEPVAAAEIALTGTDAAPRASATAALWSTPAGLKILLDADGLEPAPDGYFYEAWISNGSIRVSAGSFHVRNGHGPIELWAGVVDVDFQSLAVTLEPIDGDTDSSGDVRLRGSYDLSGG